VIATKRLPFIADYLIAHRKESAWVWNQSGAPSGCDGSGARVGATREAGRTRLHRGHCAAASQCPNRGTDSPAV
jgi:hypothetical protein